MPELPEVETVRRGLAPVLEGARITKAAVNRPDLRWPFPDNMAARLEGATVNSLRRRSKYILADLDTGETLLIHLGMSGRMLISLGRQPVLTAMGRRMPGIFSHGHPPSQKHDHVVLETEKGVRITFNDPRRFGSMDLMPTVDFDRHRLLRNLGPEPLGNAFNEAHLIAAFKGKRSPVKSALLDQRIVSGLGNIYVCEALYRARISPLRLAGNISAKRIATLVPIIREVLLDAIEAGGSSLRDHRQTSGELGYFQHTFRVYGREGQPCQTPDCTQEIRRTVQSGRSSFHCPTCQR